jgi:hypothetical protein
MDWALAQSTGAPLEADAVRLYSRPEFALPLPLMGSQWAVRVAGEPAVTAAGKARDLEKDVLSTLSVIVMTTKTDATTAITVAAVTSGPRALQGCPEGRPGETGSGP